MVPACKGCRKLQLGFVADDAAYKRLSFLQYHVINERRSMRAAQTAATQTARRLSACTAWTRLASFGRQNFLQGQVGLAIVLVSVTLIRFTSSRAVM
jgi:hypothetical protein